MRDFMDYRSELVVVVLGLVQTAEVLEVVSEVERSREINDERTCSSILI